MVSARSPSARNTLPTGRGRLHVVVTERCGSARGRTPRARRRRIAPSRCTSLSTSSRLDRFIGCRLVQRRTMRPGRTRRTCHGDQQLGFVVTPPGDAHELLRGTRDGFSPRLRLADAGGRPMPDSRAGEALLRLRLLAVDEVAGRRAACAPPSPRPMRSVHVVRGRCGLASGCARRHRRRATRPGSLPHGMSNTVSSHLRIHPCFRVTGSLVALTCDLTRDVFRTSSGSTSSASLGAVLRDGVLESPERRLPPRDGSLC